MTYDEVEKRAKEEYLSVPERRKEVFDIIKAIEDRLTRVDFFTLSLSVPVANAVERMCDEKGIFCFDQGPSGDITFAKDAVTLLQNNQYW